MKYLTTVNDVEYEVVLQEDGSILVDGRTYQVDFSDIDGGQAFSLLVDGRSFEAFLSEEDEDGMQVVIEGVRYAVDVIDEHEKLLRQAGAEAGLASGFFELAAPMPGLVVKVPVTVGSLVEKGHVLVILESVKMQNELKAPHAGVVTVVNVVDGDQVEKRDVMVVLGPLEDLDA
ncbi:MAG TPA: acetyl-CoA carboxylase biotin carboxyl carrier protein subunit [Chloroflexi bacterium]|nr:acetyl-CoA carboxylase biotin carboxyl carrier protein subunit [Chloroflexota bacterium]